MRTTVLDELSLIHDDDLVKVKDCIELVGYGDEGVVCESGAKEALDMGVARSVETRGLSLVIDDLREGEV
jgi:hypothetical protein